MADATCILVENGIRCTEPVKIMKRGWCRRHWRRWQYAGDPLAPDRRHEKRDPEERFLEKVSKHGPVPAHRPELGQCWPWTGASGENGYGTFWDEGRFHPAYRWSYRHFIGPIPDGYEIDHICHPGDGSCPFATCPHHACVNPAHLEAVTGRENTLRGHTIPALNLAKTHCPQGHPYDTENTWIRNLPGGGTGRWCKQCDRDARAARRTGRLRTHCRKGHPFDEENTIYQKGGVRRCRICARATWARRNAKVKAQKVAEQERELTGSLF